MDSNEKEIRAFGTLPDGWHFGEGVGASDATVCHALDVYALVNDKETDAIEVFPEIDGGISISAYLENQALDVSCRPDGTMEIDYEIDGDLEAEKTGLNLNDVKAHLEKLNWNKKKLSEYYIQNISSNTSKGSEHKHFSLLVSIRGSQLLAPNVLVTPAETSATTSRYFIESSQNPLCFS